MIPMKWLAIAVGLAALLAVAIAGRESTRETKVKALASAVIGETKPMEKRTAQPAIAAVRPMALPVSEKAVRVEKIRADYDAIRKGVADELAAVAAASAAGPGPYGDTRVFLRRLALLEREQHADLAQVLDARELEDFELRESSTGQLVATRLDATTATDAQRRAVFRLQREFDERFGFAFDFSREALGERERARKRMDEQIRAALGEALFAAWVAGDVR